MMLKHALTVIISIIFTALPCSALGLSAQSAALMVADSRELLYSLNSDERLPMASTTKIMTALVSLEDGVSDEIFSVPKAAVGIEGSSVYLTEGQLVTERQLLYALLLQSANDAAAALAIYRAGSTEDFAVLMNDEADALGLINTHFTNPHGLADETHYTTAAELALITAKALENYVFRDIVSTKSYTLPVISPEGTQTASRVLTNHNKLLWSYSGCVGVKTGFTKASGRCLVTAATRDGLTLIAVTLNASDDWNDHRALLDYGFSCYKSAELSSLTPQKLTVPVVGGKAASVTVILSGQPTAAVKKNASLTYTIECKRFIYAPVSGGTTVGRVIYFADGNYIAECPLITAEDVPCAAEQTGFLNWLLKLVGYR